jgi:hypothetical protein
LRCHLLLLLELCPLILDGVEQPLKVKLHPYRFDDELFHLLLKKPLFVSAAGFRSFGNYGADALVDLEPTLLNEVLNGFMRGIRVDFQSGCQGPNGGEALPRLELAADEGFLGSKDHLINNRFAGLELEAESCHMDNVTDRTGKVKEKAGRMRQPPAEPDC